MKHSVWLFLAVLCLATPLFAQTDTPVPLQSEPTTPEKVTAPTRTHARTEPKQMTGTVCNSACVQPVNGLSTCNTGCTDKSGDVVLVDDKGKVMKISNPKMAMPQMNKKVKVMAVPTEKDREEYLRILQLSEMGG